MTEINRYHSRPLDVHRWSQQPEATKLLEAVWNQQFKEADILTIDATGTIKSATSQGGNVMLLSAGDGGINWLAVYGDGTLEVYSYSVSSNSVASYRNTVGNPNVAKNSLFVSDCSAF